MDHIIHQFFEVSSQLRHALRRGIKEPGAPLSIIEMRGLEFLAREANPRQKELAAYWGITNASASAFVSKMEGLGFVQRRPDPNDKRAAILEVTPVGRTAIARTGKLASQVCRPLFEKLSEQELEQLGHILKKIHPGQQ